MSQLTAHTIVIGNEKGGAGKTTTCMHLIAYLLHLGFKVSSIDVDIRQKSLTRYLENRKITKEKKHSEILLPNHFVATESNLNNIDERNKEEDALFQKLYQEASQNVDFVVMDTPGSNTNISRIAHSYANTIITPINDSFLDLDILAKVDPDKMEISKLSHYSQVIWEQKMLRAKRGDGEINWVVIRNRLSNVAANNKRNMAIILEQLSKRVGFRAAYGFSERVIFRELFLYGLTLLDITRDIYNINFSLSHIAAKQELREFLTSLKIVQIDRALAKVSPGEKDDQPRFESI